MFVYKQSGKVDRFNWENTKPGTFDNFELQERASILNKIAFDAAKKREQHSVAFDADNDPVDPAAFDTVFENCHALLTALAKNGHRRSHALLNPPAPVAQDAKPSRSAAAAAVSSIGL